MFTLPQSADGFGTASCLNTLEAVACDSELELNTDKATFFADKEALIINEANISFGVDMIENMSRK